MPNCVDRIRSGSESLFMATSFRSLLDPSRFSLGSTTLHHSAFEIIVASLSIWIRSKPFCLARTRLRWGEIEGHLIWNDPHMNTMANDRRGTTYEWVDFLRHQIYFPWTSESTFSPRFILEVERDRAGSIDFLPPRVIHGIANG